MPAQLFFKTEDGGKYPVIFKHGDDLRQDQLILQIISLMDKVNTSLRWQGRHLALETAVCHVHVHRPRSTCGLYSQCYKAQQSPLDLDQAYFCHCKVALMASGIAHASTTFFFLPSFMVLSDLLSQIFADCHSCLWLLEKPGSPLPCVRPSWHFLSGKVSMKH